jgi:hypothetical protein
MTEPPFFIFELVRGFSCVIKSVDIVGLIPRLLLKIDPIIFFLLDVSNYLIGREIHFFNEERSDNLEWLCVIIVFI